MDTIFYKTNNVFNVVTVARNEPHRFGKNGELLVNYQDTAEHLRRASQIVERRESKVQLTSSSSDLESGKGAHLEHPGGMSDSS